MTDVADELLKQLAGKSSLATFIGTFIASASSGCQVDVGGGPIPAQLGTSYLPEINESVWVFFIDGDPFVMGSANTKPGRGTVVSTAGSLVTLTTDFGQVAVPYNNAVTPSAGQIMHLTWQGGGYADSVMSISPPPPTPPTPPTPQPIQHVDTFSAIDAGSYNSRWWTSQVRADNSDLGCWFYGSKIGDTLSAAAQVQAIQIYISAAQIQGNPPNFALHNYQSNPGGAPTLNGATAVAVSPGWVTLPTSFAAALQTGGGAAGVGVAHGGFNIFNSLASDGQSGALRITSVY